MDKSTQKVDQWVPGAEGKGRAGGKREVTAIGHTRGFFLGVIKNTLKLEVVTVEHICRYGKKNTTVYFKQTNCMASESYLNKAVCQ